MARAEEVTGQVGMPKALGVGAVVGAEKEADLLLDARTASGAAADVVR